MIVEKYYDSSVATTTNVVARISVTMILGLFFGIDGKAQNL
jgi:hypothetical protein